MNTDIRIKVGQPDHIKTKKLVQLGGEKAYRCLIRIWTKIAQDHPTGEVEISRQDIELMADWRGKKGRLADALVQSGYFDLQGNGIVPHDWCEHQRWAVHAQARSNKSRNAAKAKWDKIRSMPQASPKQDYRLLGAEISTAPSPIPSPIPIPIPIQKSKRPELTKRIQELLGNELKIKCIMRIWDWSDLDQLEISDDWVVDLYRAVFDKEAPGWVKKDPDWLLSPNAPLNIVNHFQSYQQKIGWRAGGSQETDLQVAERLIREQN